VRRSRSDYIGAAALFDRSAEALVSRESVGFLWVAAPNADAAASRKADKPCAGLRYGTGLDAAAKTPECALMGRGFDSYGGDGGVRISVIRRPSITARAGR